ncbi:MAG: hypothetical protein CBCREVIR_1097 [Candidatus Burkholderia crenata]|nr:MAG: hypothetical protein CBCREVIR_1097 [Candidatus Burkholderia crenata]
MKPSGCNIQSPNRVAIRYMTPLSSVPERLHAVRRCSGVQCAPLRRASGWCFLISRCRSPEFDFPSTGARLKAHRMNGTSTRPVLLPESLWVCPFGGAASFLCRLKHQRPTASALFRRVRRIYATEFSLSNGAGWRGGP